MLQPKKTKFRKFQKKKSKWTQSSTTQLWDLWHPVFKLWTIISFLY